MTNIDRTAEVLADWADSLGGLAAIERDYDGDMAGAAEALADAGLLMPDLPEPDNAYPEWRVGDVSISPGFNAGEVDIEWEDQFLRLSPCQALAFLAAANYDERNHHE